MRFLAPATAVLMLAACGGPDRRSNEPGGSQGGAAGGEPGAQGGEEQGDGGDGGAPGDGAGASDDQGEAGDGPADGPDDPGEDQDPDPGPAPEPDPEPAAEPDPIPDAEPEPEPERTACGWLKADHGNLEATGRSEGDVISNVRYVDQCGENMEMYDFNGEYHILYMTAAW